MILFTLKCPDDHRFEAWFKDGAAFERQAKRGLITCPVCNSVEIAKAPMAPRISKGLSRTEAPPPVQAEQAASQPALEAGPAPMAALPASPELIAAMREVVEKHCENVGDRFPEEARKMHYGEAESRGIYGQAGPEETKALQEEGIEVVSLPWPTRNG